MTSKQKARELNDERFDKPSHYNCEQCPDWDDINGCEKNYGTYCEREFDIDGEEI